MKKFTVGRFQTDEPSPGHRKILDSMNKDDVVFIGSNNAGFSSRNPLDGMSRNQGMVEVFRDGIIKQQWSLDEIRKRVRE